MSLQIREKLPSNVPNLHPSAATPDVRLLPPPPSGAIPLNVFGFQAKILRTPTVS